jgi:NAD-dependent SIR2 family protein deacetylase
MEAKQQEELSHLFQKSKRVLVITGAGISVNSGIPVRLSIR